jgi:hypothetical protein
MPTQGGFQGIEQMPALLAQGGQAERSPGRALANTARTGPEYGAERARAWVPLDCRRRGVHLTADGGIHFSLGAGLSTLAPINRESGIKSMLLM